MDKESLWRLIVKSNPGITGGAAMTPAGYRKFFDLVWDMAQKEKAKNQTSNVDDFFKGIFK